jgi:hypothetical protein
MSDQPEVEKTTLQHATLTRDRQACLLTGFLANERPHTDVLGRAPTGKGKQIKCFTRPTLNSWLPNVFFY